jgi:sugar phosphate permease
MFGMAGGSAGQFVVGPMIAAGVGWSLFWAGMGVAGLVIALLLYLLLPSRGVPSTAASTPPREDWFKSAASALGTVFRNPQSILCGMIAGLMFIPTTIFDMTWGVRYLQDAQGFEYTSAVMRSATVPFGWIIGCPLLGFISDRLGRRKPVIVAGAAGLLACLAWILYGPAGVLPPYVLGIATGIASGAAMLPYTVIKEANAPGLAGTATGVVNFLNFTFSALLGPVFGWLLVRASAGAELEHEHYQAAFQPMLYGVVVAIVLTLILKETGPKARRDTAATPVTA